MNKSSTTAAAEAEAEATLGPLRTQVLFCPYFPAEESSRHFVPRRYERQLHPGNGASCYGSLPFVPYRCLPLVIVWCHTVQRAGVSMLPIQKECLIGIGR